jgi:hypothetical protein
MFGQQNTLILVHRFCHNKGAAGRRWDLSHCRQRHATSHRPFLEVSRSFGFGRSGSSGKFIGLLLDLPRHWQVLGYLQKMICVRCGKRSLVPSSRKVCLFSPGDDSPLVCPGASSRAVVALCSASSSDHLRKGFNPRHPKL